MKNVAVPSMLAIAILTAALAACGGSSASNGYMYEKMAIFSMISITAFSIFVVVFGGSKQKNDRSSGEEGLIQDGSTYPMSAKELTSYPVYVWDYRSAFHKIVFHPDGVLLKSSSVSENGLDPTVTAVGTWQLTSGGKVLVSFNLDHTTKTYTCISRNTLAVLMKPDFGLVEAWYLGPGGLANIQISIFGCSVSVPATMKFTSALVSGRTFYWATYPCILVTSSGEVVANREAAFGLITFDEKGVLTKSIDNNLRSTIGSAPNYNPSISGTWSVDEKTGSLHMTVSGFTTTASILTQEAENGELLVFTNIENRLWFSDPTNAAEKLAAYMSQGWKLIPGS